MQFKTDALREIAFYSYIPRIFAYFIGLIVVVALFQVNDSQYRNNPWLLSILAIVCLSWPHIAYLWAKKTDRVYEAITNSLLFDSFFGGIWFPFMSFELVPCTVFITVFMINNISAGGGKLLTKGLVIMVIASLFTSLLINPVIKLESQFIIIVFCIPMIIIYPMVLAYINYKLTRLMMKQSDKLLRISRHDDLTNLYSRRYWEQRLLEEFKRCQRSKENACVMMVDVDHFKNINDTYGHLVGDNVLKQFGKLLKTLRASDIAGRYGGEEFAVLLPNSSLQESQLVAERLRQDIESTTFDSVEKCTVSIGIAELNTDYKDAYKWLDNADKALYQAKEGGRNRVKTWLAQEKVHCEESAMTI